MLTAELHSEHSGSANYLAGGREHVLVHATASGLDSHLLIACFNLSDRSPNLERFAGLFRNWISYCIANYELNLISRFDIIGHLDRKSVLKACHSARLALDNLKRTKSRLRLSKVKSTLTSKQVSP